MPVLRRTNELIRTGTLRTGEREILASGVSELQRALDNQGFMLESVYADSILAQLENLDELGGRNHEEDRMRTLLLDVAAMAVVTNSEW